jgi:hypothetical protein
MVSRDLIVAVQTSAAQRKGENVEVRLTTTIPDSTRLELLILDS